MKVALRRIVSIMLGISMVVGGVGCGKETQESEGNTKEIVVYAASSLTESLTEAAKIYESNNEGVTINLEFGSSETLKEHIRSGERCDVFISAGQTQMNQLDKSYSDNKDGVEYIESGTRTDLLMNSVVLIIPEGDEVKINGFDSMKTHLQNKDITVAMGVTTTPIGECAKKIFTYKGLEVETLAGQGLIKFGKDAKEVLAQVMSGSVDCGIVYNTDAYSSKLMIVDEATPSMCGIITYPAAVLSHSGDVEASTKFLEFLSTDTAVKCFEKVGFTAVKSKY